MALHETLALKLVYHFLAKVWFYHNASRPRQHTAASLPGAPFSRLGPRILFVFELLAHLGLKFPFVSA